MGRSSEEAYGDEDEDGDGAWDRSDNAWEAERTWDGGDDWAAASIDADDHDEPAQEPERRRSLPPAMTRRSSRRFYRDGASSPEGSPARRPPKRRGLLPSTSIRSF